MGCVGPSVVVWLSIVGTLVGRAGFWPCWLSGPVSCGGCHLTGWRGWVLAWLAVRPRGSGADVGLQVGGGLGLELVGCGAQRGPGLVPACWWVGPGNGWLVARLGGAALRQFVYFCI